MNNDDSNNNQENQSGWGGPRPGSGRPKGSGHKPKITDDLTDEQKKELLMKAFVQAADGDAKLLTFFLDHIYGKARQNIGLDGGEDGKSLVIEISEAIAKKNGIN